MAFGGLFLATGRSGALVWQSLQSRVVPYVFEVDEGPARAPIFFGSAEAGDISLWLCQGAPLWRYLAEDRP
jgi:hypothetical protein